MTTKEAFENNPSVDLRLLIQKRKEEYIVFQKLPMCQRIIFAKEEFDKRHSFVNCEKMVYSDHELRGVACSSGVVSG